MEGALFIDLRKGVGEAAAFHQGDTAGAQHAIERAAGFFPATLRTIEGYARTGVCSCLQVGAAPARLPMLFCR